MKLLKEYNTFSIYDYDYDTKEFVHFLKENFPGKFGMKSFEIFEDDGSYNAPSGRYISFNKDNYYIIAYDFIKFWEDGLWQTHTK